MLERQLKKKVLITVRTYPTPSRQQIEVSCTAGIDENNNWIRLYPIPYRFLANDKRFSKYQYIEALVQKATSDTRPESYKVNPESIKIVSPPIPIANQWKARKEIIYPLKVRSLCELQALRDANQYPTLGFFKPKEIIRLEIKPEKEPEWTEKQLTNLRQYPLFGNALKSELEKIPFVFTYVFRCDDLNCHTIHKLSCTDWEMGTSYRKWINVYGNNWETKFRQKYFDFMKARDTHFFVGTIQQHPGDWIIIGLFYPPQVVDINQPKLF